MKKMLIIGCFSLLLVFLLTVAGFAEGITVGFIASNMGADSNVAAYEGFKAYADKDSVNPL